MDDQALVTQARQGDSAAFERLVAPHRGELRMLCYRISGSLHDADDLIQDSLLKAWSRFAAFEARSSVRTWLFRVTTSVCLDALDARKARGLPTGAGSPSAPGQPMAPTSEPVWLSPCPDGWLDAAGGTPETRYSARESVALAFLAAIQLLPPRQRAALILCDVVGFSAAECAGVLEMTVAGVNSALQRARGSLDADRPRPNTAPPDDASTRALLNRYVQAWQQADVEGLIGLLKHDAVLSMPPFAAWFKGAQDIAAALRGMVLPPEAAGRFKLLPIRANGCPALAMYGREKAASPWRAASLHVLWLDGTAISEILAFLDPSLFPGFGLPLELPAADS
jgi:RNA polymerase sigma-70 factor (ECF subfamily)